MKEGSEFIKIKAGHIDYAFRYMSTMDGDRRAVYIPAYDIYFSSPDDKEKIESRARNMVQSFYKFWFEHEGQKQFFLKIHTLGFRTENHNYALKRLLNKDIFNTNFQSSVTSIPETFKGSEFASMDGKYELAEA